MLLKNTNRKPYTIFRMVICQSRVGVRVRVMLMVTVRVTVRVVRVRVWVSFTFMVTYPLVAI